MNYATFNGRGGRSNAPRYILWALVIIAIVTTLMLLFGTAQLNPENNSFTPVKIKENLRTVSYPAKSDKTSGTPVTDKKVVLDPHTVGRNKNRPKPSVPKPIVAPTAQKPPSPISPPPVAEIPLPPAPLLEFTHPDQAYVIMLTNDKPMHLVWALEASLRNVSATRRRIALVTPKVSRPMRTIMERLQMEVIEILQLTHPKFKTVYDRWKDTLAKFAIFDLNVTKFVYLDTDILINDNIDDYFDLDTNGLIHGMLDRAACDNTSTGMNAGLLVASPNATLKQELLATLDGPENPTKDGNGDQEILNRYLIARGMMRTRPEHDMSFLWRCSCVEEKKVKRYDWATTRIIHFTGWYMDVPALVKAGINSRSWEPLCAMPWYYRWVDVHRDLRNWWEQYYGPMPDMPIVKL